MNKPTHRHLLPALLFATAGLAATTSQAQSQWTAGLVGMAAYQQEWTPAALPWLSYRNDRLTVNPMKIALIGQYGPMQWEAGLGLDYSELFDDTERGFLTQLDTQTFIGPLRFTANAAARIKDPINAWQTNTALGSQMPLGNGLLGAELGLHSEATQWDDSITRSTAVLAPTGAVQYGMQFGDWQTMAIAQWQGKPINANETRKQTYTLLLMYNW
ncbi:MAG: hypothetical protein R3309_00175 [Reinekea sp.]|nr:hypothetical protein [Reinekea sp.]